jgi:CubicO group peptidase (beta-lactamase class C family)
MMNGKRRSKQPLWSILTLAAAGFILLPIAGLAQTPKPRPQPGMTAKLAAQVRSGVESILKAWNVPGAAVGIVRDGKVIYLEGFGKRDVEKNLPVTPRTRFILGSTTKAFTTMALGLLAHENKLDWDKPVSSYLPDFRLQDDYATLHATVRDLAVHRTGLPRHDMVWFNSPMDMGELVRTFRFLEPSRELRAVFQYNNLMYMTLGLVVEKAAGMPWDAFVREKIFTLLRMDESGCSVPEYAAAADRALSYRFEKGRFFVQPLPQPEAKLMSGPRASGSVNTTAADMCRWVTAHLEDGRVDGAQIFPEDTVREMHMPQIVIPSGPGRNIEETLSPSYALGWMTDVYRNQWRVHHGGSTQDFNSYVSLFPREKTGLVVLINASSPAIDVLALSLSDIALGLSPIDWTRRAQEEMKELQQAEPQEKRIEGANPAHKLEEYAGEYVHPAYGVLAVEKAAEKLRGSFHGLTFSLEPWHYETFIISDGPLQGEKLTFKTSPQGEVKAVASPLEPAVKDIVFERRSGK